MKTFKTLNKVIKEIETKSLFDRNYGGTLFNENLKELFKEYRFPYCKYVYSKELLKTDALEFGYSKDKNVVYWYESVNGGVKIYCINDNILNSKNENLVRLYNQILNIFNTLN